MDSVSSPVRLSCNGAGGAASICAFISPRSVKELHGAHLTGHKKVKRTSCVQFPCTGAGVRARAGRGRRWTSRAQSPDFTGRWFAPRWMMRNNACGGVPSPGSHRVFVRHKACQCVDRHSPAAEGVSRVTRTPGRNSTRSPRSRTSAKTEERSRHSPCYPCNADLRGHEPPRIARQFDPLRLRPEEAAAR